MGCFDHAIHEVRMQMAFDGVDPIDPRHMPKVFSAFMDARYSADFYIALREIDSKLEGRAYSIALVTLRFVYSENSVPESPRPESDEPIPTEAGDVNGILSELNLPTSERRARHYVEFFQRPEAGKID